MISIDTNILFTALEEVNDSHGSASAFLESLVGRNDVVISEFVLIELYNLLRNPVILIKPRSSAEAVEICQSFRNHPHWQIVGFPPDSRRFYDEFWLRLVGKQFARRRTYDWRIALSLLHHGVTDFATVNLKDFQGFGFRRVWNPIS